MRPSKKLLITLLLITGACSLVVVGSMYFVSYRREAQKVQLRASVIQVKIQIAEAGQQTNSQVAEGKKLAFDADINSRLDDLSDLTEQVGMRGQVKRAGLTPRFRPQASSLPLI